MYTLNPLKLIINIWLVADVIVAQRRILNGTMIGNNEEKRYVVYLVKATVSPMAYEGWICGGALVTTEYIVTSAACVEDVKHLYAIAGYKKYVTDIYNDPCTKFAKKKIVYSCVPKSYDLNYARIDKWSFIDIAVVKVESPYNFLDNDEFKKNKCDYTPRAIQVNYEDKFQEPNIDAIALGWGHKDKWRKDGDLTNYNQADLHYASILLADKEECKKHYADYKGMADVIDDYMICSMGEGNINSQGLLKKKSPPADGCGNSTKNNSAPSRLLALEGMSCDDGTDEGDIVFVENTRKNTKENDIISKLEKNHTNSGLFESNNDSNNTATFVNMNTRRHGICQNDHGGPIVTWVGSHEVLIGVASVFKVSDDYSCIGPFLYTSTQCSGAFLDCILSPDNNNSTRKAFCEASPEKKGFDQVETKISWRNHPDGPADNERYLVRPQHAQYGI